jgi:hypothetical protein
MIRLWLITTAFFYALPVRTYSVQLHFSHDLKH